MSVVHKICFVMFIFVFINNGYAKPFLINTITSLFSASSNPPEVPLQENGKLSEHITIIPKKPIKIVEESQNNNTDFDITFETTTTTQSPYTPGNLAQRKLNKVIQKIIKLTQIHNALQGNFQPNNNEDEPKDFEFEDETMNSPYRHVDLEEEPLKINLQNGVNNEEVMEEKMEELRPVPPSFGIFVLEMFAQLIGLTLGAANQVTYSINQNNTV